MKRPFACIGFSMLFSLVLATAFHTAVIATAVVCFALFAALVFLKAVYKKDTLTAAVCCISACIALASYACVTNLYVYPIINTYDGRTSHFRGTVTSEPSVKNGSTCFTVRTDRIDDIEKHLNISVTISQTTPVKIYDTVECYAPLDSCYESGYGYQSYYGARNIFLSAYINPYFGSEYNVTSATDSDMMIESFFNTLRKRITGTFFTYLSYDEASLCSSITTGDSSLLSDDISGAFRKLGISHILVVSGLHLSVVAGLLQLLLSSFMPNRKRLSLVLQLIGITAFAMLTGLGFSVRRAYIMAVLSIVGQLVSRKPEGINSLGLAAMILCINPLSAGDTGMLWSFSCTLSILMFNERLSEYIIKRLEIKRSFTKSAVLVFTTSFSASIGSIPFMIFITGSLSPYMIAVNIITVPFTGIIITAGIVGAVFSAAGLTGLAYPCMYISGLTAKYLIYVTDIFSELPFASIRSDYTFVKLWFFISVSILLALSVFNKKRLLRYFTALSAAVLLLLFSLNVIIYGDDIMFSVLDVGNGMTAVLKDKNGIGVIASYGEKYQYSTIKSEVSEYGTILFMEDMPPPKVKYNYCTRLLNDFTVSNIYVCDESLFNGKYLMNGYLDNNVTLTESNHCIHTRDEAAIHIIKSETCVWQYLTVYDTEILICPANADFSQLPPTFSQPNIAVISSLPDNFKLDNSVYIVVSAFGDECNTTLKELSGMGFTAEATNGLGRIDFTFSSSGNIKTERVYTGGVTQYADNQ